MTPAAEQRIRAAVAALGDALVAALAEAEPGDGPDRLLGVDEAADALGIGRSLVYDLLARQELRSCKVGRRRLVPSSALREFTERRQ